MRLSHRCLSRLAGADSRMWSPPVSLTLTGGAVSSARSAAAGRAAAGRPVARRRLDRVGEQQRLHGQGAGRALGRVCETVPESLQHGVQLLVQLLQFFRGHVSDVIAVVGRLVPLPGIAGFRFLPPLIAGERTLPGQAQHRLARDLRLRVVRGGDVPSDGCQPPGPGPPLPAARFLDEPVLRQLAQVERAGGRRLADLACSAPWRSSHRGKPALRTARSAPDARGPAASARQ